MDTTWQANLKDAGLESVTEEILERAIKEHGRDEVSALVSDFKKARERNKNAQTFAEGKASDLVYSRAFQRLVKIGFATQIKKKYRGK